MYVVGDFLFVIVLQGVVIGCWYVGVIGEFDFCCVIVIVVVQGGRDEVYCRRVDEVGYEQVGWMVV